MACHHCSLTHQITSSQCLLKAGQDHGTDPLFLLMYVRCHLICVLGLVLKEGSDAGQVERSTGCHGVIQSTTHRPGVLRRRITEAASGLGLVGCTNATEGENHIRDTEKLQHGHSPLALRDFKECSHIYARISIYMVG